MWNLNQRRYVVELCSIVLGSLMASTAAAGTFLNQKCVPIPMPVMTCGCPVPGIFTDICEGQVPKDGTTLGEVGCMSLMNSQCVFAGGTPVPNNMPCGKVKMCTTQCRYACNSPIMQVSNDPNCNCIDHPTKPPCQTTWGNCAWSPPPPGP